MNDTVCCVQMDFLLQWIQKKLIVIIKNKRKLMSFILHSNNYF